MSMAENTTFLNVDLILRGLADFSPLLSALGDSVLVLHTENQFACLELPWIWRLMRHPSHLRATVNPTVA